MKLSSDLARTFAIRFWLPIVEMWRGKYGMRKEDGGKEMTDKEDGGE